MAAGLVLVLALTAAVSGRAAAPAAAAPGTVALHTVDPVTPAGLRTLLQYDGESLHLVAAHRGGARSGYPENCIATFEDTLRYGHAMIEVDPRYTRDGAIVLHHDARLERTTNGKGRLADFTLAELKGLRLRDSEGILTGYAMPTLDEALVWARGKTILVLDRKTVPLGARIQKIESHRAEAYTLVIVYSFEEARACYQRNPAIMMEVMIPARAAFDAFEQTGVPWSNVVAFVGHSPPRDAALLRLIHERGACCMAGSSRNLDRQLLDGVVSDVAQVADGYRGLIQSGVDLVETDLPVEVGRLLYGDRVPPASRAAFLRGSR
jgi:glycerophosphoryl diester phosphodiesterase